MKISINTANELITNYCVDEPKITAEQLSELELALETDTGKNWVRVFGELGLKQDDLDAILY